MGFYIVLYTQNVDVIICKSALLYYSYAHGRLGG